MCHLNIERINIHLYYISGLLMSTQAIGEAPVVAGVTIFMAIKQAIMAARAEVGISGNFRLSCPATVERIRMACTDQFVDMFTKDV
jgi:xanthine dehydrogenase/oxidase